MASPAMIRRYLARRKMRWAVRQVAALPRIVRFSVTASVPVEIGPMQCTYTIRSWWGLRSRIITRTLAP